MKRKDFDDVIEENLKWLFEDFVKDNDISSFYKGVIKEMLIEASNMKKAEIIKNGNVNLKSKNKYYDDYIDFCKWIKNYELKEGRLPTPSNCFNWLYERLS